MFGANPTQHITETRELFGIKKMNGIEQSTENILEENMFQTAFQHTMGDKFPF